MLESNLCPVYFIETVSDTSVIILSIIDKLVYSKNSLLQKLTLSPNT